MKNSPTIEMRNLMRLHRYDEAIREAERCLTINRDDWAAVGVLAKSLQAVGRYADALPLFERLDCEESSDVRAKGRPGRQLQISCLYWLMGERSKAVDLMHSLVSGILDRSIQYGDLAGGVSQGLLLFYMGVTAERHDEVTFALDYMRNRTGRLAATMFPGPVAQFYLGQARFDEVLLSATKRRTLEEAVVVANADLLSRRQLCVALFHAGARERAGGDAEGCLKMMQMCASLENPLAEPEWYLARHEVDSATI
jgi:tetratricopeptide (TPR) repeat protein